MGRRVLPVVLVLLAFGADARALHAAATYLLVAAVPAAAAAVLTCFGALVQLPGRSRGVARLRAEVALGALALAAVVVAAAARAGVDEGAGVPPLAVSALAASVAAFGVQGFVALMLPSHGSQARARPRRPVSAGEQPAQAA